ncbi:MAG: tRNA threonylcarbamoyladenosine dehydratase [Clostridia bacterium]|nr:tRNA threonylcarbamoyladenosine dehydratase [Clostridia bacterium]
MKEEFNRTAMLIGEENVEKLSHASVALFGLGGVGSYCAEALARCGIGKIMIVDCDVVSRSNINRQLCALQSTVGRYKTEVVAERLLDINPDLKLDARCERLTPDNIDTFDLARYDYIIDAIDTVSAKLALVEKAQELGIPMISSMGTGNKTNPSALTVSDISKTSVCPLARVMRRELKKRGIYKLKVIFSTEEPKTPTQNDEKKAPPASIAFVPSVAGLLAASEAVKEILSLKN